MLVDLEVREDFYRGAFVTVTKKLGIDGLQGLLRDRFDDFENRRLGVEEGSETVQVEYLGICLLYVYRGELLVVFLQLFHGLWCRDMRIDVGVLGHGDTAATSAIGRDGVSEIVRLSVCLL